MSLLGRRLARLGLALAISLVTLASGMVTARAPGADLAQTHEPDPPLGVQAVWALAPTPEVADAPYEPYVEPKVAPEQRLRQIPVLMYHEVGDVNNNNYIRRAELDAQLKWLADNGYHTVTLDQVYRHINDFVPLPANPVVLTFDDGYETFYTIVVPALRQYNFTATAFISTGLLGRREHMSWAQVAELPKLGIEIGSHTVSHADLRYLTGARLARELVEAKHELEERAGVRVAFFCYPAGKYNDLTPDAVQGAGYLGAVTTQYGPITLQQSPFLWSRVRILRGETQKSFAKKIQDASSEGP